jgi:hypothetical protein
MLCFLLLDKQGNRLVVMEPYDVNFTLCLKLNGGK